MINLQTLIIGCVISLFLATTAWSATHYVAPDENGEDPQGINDGTEDHPWPTIQKAANVAKAGDTVYVKNGVYYEWVDVKNTGRKGKPITFKAYPGHMPIIDGTGVKLPDSWKALFHSNGNNYIIIDGFEVRNTDAVLIRLRNGDHLTIRNCIAHDNANADGSDNNHSGIFIDHCNHGLVENNEVYHSGHNAINAESTNNVIIQSNYVHDNPNHNGINIFPKTSEPQIEYSGNHIQRNMLTGATNGIYCRYQKNNKISNNLIYGNAGCGIRFVSDQADPHQFKSDTKIFNNTIVDNQNNGIQSSNASHVTIKNNIIAYNDDYSIFLANGVTAGADIDHNLYYSTPMFSWAGAKPSSLSSWIALSGQDKNSLEADPMFFDRSENDYRLTSDSTDAIDKGKDLSAFGISYDIDGISRPQGNGHDIGAYEYTSGDPEKIVPPTNLEVMSY